MLIIKKIKHINAHNEANEIDVIGGGSGQFVNERAVILLNRNLESIQSEIRDLVSYVERNENVIALYIFGSFGTSLQNERSDIDLAVLFKNTPPFFDELGMESDISQIFGSDDIDIVNLNKASIDISHQVVYTGELLYCKDEIELADFKERVFNIYGDFGIILKKYYDDYQEGLREDYGKDR